MFVYCPSWFEEDPEGQLDAEVRRPVLAELYEEVYQIGEDE